MAAWVLERVRQGPQNVSSAPLTYVQKHKRTVSKPTGPLTHMFTDKHVQSTPRFQLSEPQQQQQQAQQQHGVAGALQQPLRQDPTQHVLQQQQPPHERFQQSKHRALAERLAAVKARQERRQQYQEQQQQQHAHSKRHGTFSACAAADIALVCAEVKLPRSVAAALSAAAAKGLVSCNPGILLPQLLRLLPLEPQLSALLGQQDSLAVLLSAQPTLLHADPRSLQANCQHLQELLGQHAAAAAKRCPQILGCSPYRLAANLTMLQELLGYSSISAVAAVAVRQPMLLLCSSDNLQCRWQQLQQLLAAVPADKLSKQLRRTPELLLMRPSTLAAKLKCLELLFATDAASKQPAAQAAVAAGLSATPVTPGRLHSSSGGSSGAHSAGEVHAAVQSVQQQTAHLAGGAQQESQQQQQQKQKQRLLGVYKHHQMSYRLQRLQQLAQQHGAPPAWSSHYGYGHTNTTSSSGSPHNTAACVPAAAAPAAAAAVPSSSGHQADPRVQHLALKVPGLLCLNPATLHSHVIELQLLLGLQPDDPRLSRLVLLQPGLLTQAPRTLANKLQLLQHLTGQDEAYVVQMVLRCPAVLTLSAASVRKKWGVLQGCVAACRTWQQQLAAAPPVSVGMMLCYGIHRLQRLQYVVHLSREQQGVLSQQSVPSPQQEGEQGMLPPQQQVLDAPPSTTVVHSSRPARRRQHRAPANAVGSSCSDSISTSSMGSRHSGSGTASVGQSVVEVGQWTAGGQVVPAIEQGIADLASLPWRSMVQEADSVFGRRFPGFKAWLQQQQV